MISKRRKSLLPKIGRGEHGDALVEKGSRLIVSKVELEPFYTSLLASLSRNALNPTSSTQRNGSKTMT